ncbi:MAG: DUF4328 domain-containing protein [Phaeodactylibacter sp.]|nr:DUF4328 domain-containing protein [Phaeodactylibacter sp.]
MQLKYNGDRAKWILLLFYILLFITPVSAVFNYLEYALISGGGIYDEGAAVQNDARQGILGLVQLAHYIITVVFFIMWFRRAYWNVHVISSNTQFTEGWAAGSWFVPFLNLVRPYQIMKEIWNETQQAIAPARFKPDQLVGWWWATFLIGGALDNIAARLTWRAQDLEQFETAAAFMTISDLFSFIPLILIIILIRDIRSFEEELYREKRDMRIEDHLLDPDVV